jgi:PAS domain S-box-containing protein
LVQLKNSKLAPAIKNHHIRVLHVDDDAGFLELSKKILMDMGNFEVDDACCVDEAFKKLAICKFDIIVSDYEMPEKNGLQFLKELRSQNIEIPFILFTGKGREEIAMLALKLGSDGYINKQGQIETVYGELASGIRQSVARTQEEDAARRDEQSRKDQFRILSDFSSKINLAETLEEICVLVCSKIKESIGQGYVVVTLIDEAEQYESIIAAEGFNDKGMVNSAIRLLGGDPRGWVYAVKDMLPEELEQFRSGKLELITGGLYALMARRQPKAVCRIIEHLMEVSFVYAVGFVHKNRYLGGAEIMLNSQSEIQKNESLIEALMGQASPVLSRFYSEQKLLESEYRHRVISNLMADVAFSYIKSEGDTFAIDWITGAAEKVLGCSVEEIKKRGSWKFVVAPQDFTMFDERVVGLNPGQSSICELKIIQADGVTRWIRVFSRVEKDKANPKIHRLFGAVEDISGRKKVEEELIKNQLKIGIMNEKLHVVGALTRHDVANKLAVIRSLVYLLEKQIGDNPKNAKYLQDIDSAIDSSDKIFEFSRIYEKIGVEQQNMNVEECFNHAKHLFSNFGIIKIVNDCQGLEVRADSLLRQLFYNLIDNSLKHGGKVTKICLHYRKDENGVKLFYEDNGVGIPDANKSRIFELGFTTGKGSGFGLSLVKKLVEVNGWTITETGKPGKGIKFEITIPA